MSIAHKLTLLAMLAIAATALAAPSALAQTEPLAHDQSPQMIVTQEIHGSADAACPAVTPSPVPVPGPLVTAGGCRTHVVGENIELYAHLSAGGVEILSTVCNAEYDVRVDAAGEGYSAHQEFTQPTNGGSCVRKACGQVTPPTSEGRAYSYYLRETEPAPTERATIVFCTAEISSGQEHHCEITVPVTSPAPHAGRTTAADISAHGVAFPHCEIGSPMTPAVFNTEVTLGTTNEAQQEQRVEVRHQ